MRIAIFVGQPVYYDDKEGLTANYIGLIDWLLYSAKKVELMDIYLPMYKGRGKVKLKIPSNVNILSIYPKLFCEEDKPPKLRYLLRLNIIKYFIKNNFKEKYNIVGFTPPFSPFSILLSLLSSKPIFFLVRGDFLKTTKYHYRKLFSGLFWNPVVKIFDRIISIMLCRGSLIIAVGNYATKRYIKSSFNVYSVEPLISSKIINMEKKTSNSVSDILYVGRLANEKGIYDLIHSFKKLIKLNNKESLTLHIVGSGPEEENLKSFVKELNIERLVVFHGFIPPGKKLWRLYDACQIFVNPAYTGAGRTVYEAMARGVAVVTTMGGISYLLEDRVNCIAIEPGDIKQLTDAMNTLITDKKLRRRLIRNGYKTAIKVTFERQAYKMIEILENSIK